jgi:hypothetical protein
MMCRSASVNQTKKCPFCGSKIEVTTLQCQFCGSDLGDSASATQLDARPRKSLRRLGFEFLVMIMFVVSIFCVYELVMEYAPERQRQWLAWLFGSSVSPFGIIFYSLALFYIAARWIVRDLKPVIKNRCGQEIGDKKRRIPDGKRR